MASLATRARARIDRWTRKQLLRSRIHHVPDTPALDPNGVDYLYLVQQHRRLKLTRKIARLRPRNIVLLPLILIDILLSSVCLWITNQLVGSMINEHRLMNLGNRSGHADGEGTGGGAPLAATADPRPAPDSTGPSA